jgi:predicted transposase/invertase (TIGR01784 family)
VPKEPLSPKNDLVFKLLFGERKRLKILRNFLQAVLDLPAEEYSRLVIVDPHLRGEHPDDKLGVLDVKVHTTTGKVIDVEIQVKPHSRIWERILFYAARLTTEQLKSGVPYTEIKKAVSIIIVDGDITTKDSEHYHHCFRLFDERTGYRFPDLFEINTLELPKLPRQPDGSPLYNWLRMFTARSKEEFDMVAKTSPEVAEAVGVIMELSEDECTRLLAEEREKYRRDEEARREDAYEEGEKKGRLEGEQTGEQKGRLEVARRLLLEKDPVERVAKVAGLSLEEVKTLALELSIKH